MKKLTPNMVMVLFDLLERKNPLANVDGRSQAGGYHSVILGLIQRGLIDTKGRTQTTHLNLTPAGRSVAKSLRQKLKAQ